MTPAELATYVRTKTRTNSTTFTDASILVFLNQRIDDIAIRIANMTSEDYFLVPQTTDLVASSTVDKREYAFPTDVLSSLKRVEISFDGTDFIKINEIDMNTINTPLTEAGITNQFANLEGECFYDLRRRSLFIYSGTITAVTGGLKLWIETFPAHITDLASTTDMSVDPSTTTHGLPREIHKILATGVIIDYKESKEKPIPLSEGEGRYELDLRRGISSLKHISKDRDIIGSLPQASDRGNDGVDY